MTIDVKAGRPIYYECPECHEMARGLINGHCHKCEAKSGQSAPPTAYQRLNFGPELD